MEKKTIWGIVALVIVILIGYWIFAKRDVQAPVSSDNGEESMEANMENSESDMMVGEEGIIEGTLTYPSQGIPSDMEVCAKTADSDMEYCTSEHLNDSKYTTGVGYMLSVPAGRYEVFARLADGTTAYYNEFVTCGLNVACPSHAKLMVDVVAGETVSSIDPGDWYDTANAN